MGIFDKIFKRRKKEEVKEEKQEQFKVQKNGENLDTNKAENTPITTHHCEIDNSDQEAYIFDIRKINRVKHRDGRNCDVYMLRAKICKQKAARSQEFADYVCFEVKENTRIDRKLLDYVAGFYLNKTSENMVNEIETDRFYLGEIEEDKEDPKNEYKLGEKSYFVEEEFNSFIDKREQLEKIQREGEKSNQDTFREELIVKGKNEKEKNLKLEERVKDFYLKQVAQGIDNKGKKYQEYEGINISNGGNRGYILEIKAVQKLGKDGSGTYLYSGYIGNTLDKKGVEYFDYWNMTDYNLMTPVCFELYRRLDDIVKDENTAEIEAVLKFLSAPQNFKGSGKINYIGHLNQITTKNQYGEIETKIVEEREEKSSSPTIERQIKKIQGDYVLKNRVFLGGGR